MAGQIPQNPEGLPNLAHTDLVGHNIVIKIIQPQIIAPYEESEEIFIWQDWHSNSTGVRGVRQQHIRIGITKRSPEHPNASPPFTKQQLLDIFQEPLKVVSNYLASQLPERSWTIKTSFALHRIYNYGKYGLDWSAAHQDQDYLANNPDLPICTIRPGLYDGTYININLYYASNLKYSSYLPDRQPKFKVGDRVRIPYGGHYDHDESRWYDHYIDAHILKVGNISPNQVTYWVKDTAGREDRLNESKLLLVEAS